MIRRFRSFAATSPADDPTGSGRGEIRPPEDTRHLLQGLAALWPSYPAYAITFLLIGQVWATITSCSTTSGSPTGWCCSSTPCC
jgi:hypothetical protein